MNALYQGHVAHTRPGKHKLRYRVFMLALDLDELDALDLRCLKHNKPGLLALYDRDHGDGADAPLKPQIERKLRDANIGWSGGRIVLLTMPRLMNYVFNPLSVYFCYAPNGDLVAIAHEVSNTFGERHFYVLPPHAEPNGALTQSCAKDFFVSPFLETALRYEFRIVPPGENAVVAMTVKRGAEVALTASFQGQKRALTDASILRAWLANPLMTLKVIAGIHWEAVKMMLKGVRYLGRPKPAQTRHVEGAALSGGAAPRLDEALGN